MSSQVNKKMNLKQKIVQMRLEFIKMNVKKTGYNNYSNYSFYELADIIPPTKELEAKYGVYSFMDFKSKQATLTILDTDSDDIQVFTISTDVEDTEARMSTTSKSARGMHPVQRLGSVVTYMKRYLYINYMDIVEFDGVDNMRQDCADNVKNNHIKNENQPANPELLAAVGRFKKFAETYPGGQSELVKKYGVTKHSTAQQLNRIIDGELAKTKTAPAAATDNKQNGKYNSVVEEFKAFSKTYPGGMVALVKKYDIKNNTPAEVLREIMNKEGK